MAASRLAEKREAFLSGLWSPWEDNGGPGPLTLKQAVERFLKDKEQTVRRATAEQYRSKLTHFRRDHAPAGIMLQNVGEEHVRSYVYALNRPADKPPIKQSTKAMRFRHVRCFFNWTVKTGLLDRSPMADMEEPKKGRTKAAYLTPEQVRRLLRCISAHRERLEGEPGPTPDDRWLARMIRVALGTGLRRGELLALRWADVDLDERMLYVRNREGFATKSGDERAVHLRGDALDALRELHFGQTGPVFLLPDGSPPKPGRVTKRFKFYVREAGLRDRERIKFHSLRHSTASWLVQQGVPMAVVASIMGHSSSRVTEDHYAHISPDVTAKAMEETFGS